MLKSIEASTTLHGTLLSNEASPSSEGPARHCLLALEDVLQRWGEGLAERVQHFCVNWNAHIYSNYPLYSTLVQSVLFYSILFKSHIS